MIPCSIYGMVTLDLTPALSLNWVAMSPIRAMIILSTLTFLVPSIWAVASTKSNMPSRNGLNFSRHPESSAAIIMTMYWSIITYLSSARNSRVSSSTSWTTTDVRAAYWSIERVLSKNFWLKLFPLYMQRSPSACKAGSFIFLSRDSSLRMFCKHGTKSSRYSFIFSPMLPDRSEMMPQASLAQSLSFDSSANLM